MIAGFNKSGIMVLCGANMYKKAGKGEKPFPAFLIMALAGEDNPKGFMQIERRRNHRRKLHA